MNSIGQQSENLVSVMVATQCATDRVLSSREAGDQERAQYLERIALDFAALYILTVHKALNGFGALPSNFDEATARLAEHRKSSPMDPGDTLAPERFASGAVSAMQARILAMEGGECAMAPKELFASIVGMHASALEMLARSTENEVAASFARGRYEIAQDHIAAMTRPADPGSVTLH